MDRPILFDVDGFTADGRTDTVTSLSWPRLAPPYRCGTLTNDNMETALLRHPQGLNWSGSVTWTEGGTAIIRGEKADLEPNKGGSDG